MTKKRDITNKVQSIINNQKTFFDSNGIDRKNTNLFNSISSRDNFAFYLDLLKILIGGNEVNKVFNKIISETNTIFDSAITETINKLKSKYGCSNPFIIQDKYIDSYTFIPIGQIDFFENLMKSPNDMEGIFLYETDPNGFNRKIFDAIQNSSPSNPVNFNNILIFYFDEANDYLYFKIDNSFRGQNILTLINALSPFLSFDKFNIFGQLFDYLTSNISASTSRTAFENKLFLGKLISRIKLSCSSELNSLDDNQVLNNINSLETTELINEINSPTFFVFDDQEYIRAKRNEIDFYTCSNVSVKIDNSTFNDYASQFVNEYNGYTEQNKKTKALTKTLNRIVDDNASSFIDKNDLKTAKLEVFERLVLNIVDIFGGLILSPKIALTYNILDILFFDNLTIYDFKLFINSFFEVIFSTIKTLFSKIFKIIFNIVKKEIVRLTGRIILQIVKEQNSANLAIINNLRDLIRKFNGISGVNSLRDFKDCGNKSLDFILSLLELSPNVVTPSLIPPPLLLGANFRNGISETRAFSRLQEEYQKLGIPIDDLPDGTKNPVLLANKAMLKVIFDEIRNNSKIESVNTAPIIAPAPPGVINIIGVMK